MVGTWFRERFQLIGDRLGDYDWANKGWVQNITAPARRAYDMAFNQNFNDGDVDFEDTQDDREIVYGKKKGYIVWYSGQNYDVKREISFTFWVDVNDTLNSFYANSWRDQVIDQAFGGEIRFEQMRSAWTNGSGFSYEVRDASLGLTTTSLSEQEWKFIKWEYTSNGKQLRNGEIEK